MYTDVRCTSELQFSKRMYTLYAAQMYAARLSYKYVQLKFTEFQSRNVLGTQKNNATQFYDYAKIEGEKYLETMMKEHD